MALPSPGLEAQLGGTSTMTVSAPPTRGLFVAGPITWARCRLVTDTRRAIQIALGLIWLLDGALQFQAFMYGRGFIAALKASGTGQPLSRPRWRLPVGVNPPASARPAGGRGPRR